MSGRIKRTSEEPKRTLPIIGKLKIGEKAEGTGYPKSLDYFKADGKYADLFNKTFPTNQNKIQIVFVSDNVEEVCNERFECWDTKGRKVAHGDGENFFLFNEKSKEYDIQVKKEEALEKTKGSKWSAVLTLRFLIPEIRGVMGLWQLDTKGAKSSIGNLRDTFDSVMEKAGRVRGIPFDLLVKKHTSKKPGATSVYPVLDLVPNLSQESMLILSQFSGSAEFDKIGVLTDDSIWESKPLELNEDRAVEEIS